MAKKNTLSDETQDFSEETQAPETIQEAALEVPEGKQQIVILKVPFLVNAPFFEGHPLSSEEAHALNRLRAENIRNNFAARMSAAAEKNEPALGQTELDAYDSEYKFGVRTTRFAAVLSPVDVEEKRLALEAVKKALTKRGFKLKSFSKEDIDSHVAGVIKQGLLRKKAERIVEARGASEEVEINIAA